MDIYNKLEYNQIIQIIQKYCKTYLGKNCCFNIKPAFSYEKVETMLLETLEAVSLIYKKGTPPFAELNELEPYIKILESNQTLSSKALLDLANLLKVCRELKCYFKEDFFVQNNNSSKIVSNFNDSKDFEDLKPNDSCLLEGYFYNLYSNESVENDIFSKILDENTISDNASSTLANLRRKRKAYETSIKDKLTSILHSSSYSKYLMEPVITIRNNRYVIPLKQEYRTMIDGFIHDISSSGSTVYIEPTSIFELNNQIAELKLQEDIEIEKILQSLSSLFFDIIPQLHDSLFTVGVLDLIFAKASYSKDNNYVMPVLNEDKKIDLKKARHPLIDKSKVVPINISIGENYTSLVITGPNTGGKTVALKTLGLTLLMAYSGILIPCHEESSICVLDNIFVDIGDEQNIMESLSTFSSHILNIVQIINLVTSNSLVLLDELGSGTDPIEGSSLAIAILEYFYNVGALVCSTTHYQELKEFAVVTDGFENASFEFDLEKLTPTYNLLVGIPGKSNAFEISKRLGLLPNIIERASSFIKEDHACVEELLKGIYDDKLELEKQKEESEKNLNQIAVLRKSLESEKENLDTKKQKILDDAKDEARNILLSAKDEASRIIKELEESNINSKYANQLRNKLNDDLKDISPIAKNLRYKGTIKLTDLSKSSISDIDIQDNLKSEKSSKAQNQSSKVTANLQNSKTKFISPEINVIGQTVDDAIYVIDKYLDDCAISGISPVRIVHGKGTGKLREGIHKYLKKNSHVKLFRIGTFGEGELGVTIVELK